MRRLLALAALLVVGAWAYSAGTSPNYTGPSYGSSGRGLGAYDTDGDGVIDEGTSLTPLRWNWLDGGNDSFVDLRCLPATTGTGAIGACAAYTATPTYGYPFNDSLYIESCIVGVAGNGVANGDPGGWDALDEVTIQLTETSAATGAAFAQAAFGGSALSSFIIQRDACGATPRCMDDDGMEEWTVGVTSTSTDGYLQLRVNGIVDAGNHNNIYALVTCYGYGIL
jgi:hypothetical protein